VEWQLIAVGLVIVGAICYLGHQTWRSWRASKKGCGGGCGCHAKANTSVTLISTAQLTSRLRAKAP